MRRGGASALPDSIFPFLAVLVSAMGALILLLLVISRQAQWSRERAAAERSNLPPWTSPYERESLPEPVEYPPLAKLPPFEESKLESFALPPLPSLEPDPTPELERQRDRLRNQLAQSQRDADHALDPDLAELAARIAELRSLLDRIEAEREKAEERKLEDQRTLTDLENRRRVLASEPAGTKFAVLPYDGPHGSTRRPIYLECLDDRIVLRPEGIEITAAQLRYALVDPNNPLTTMVASIAAKMRREDPHSDPYPLLLVRPGGIGAFYLARKALEVLNLSHGYETLPGEIDVAFAEPDPVIAKVARTAVERAAASLRARLSGGGSGRLVAGDGDGEDGSKFGDGRSTDGSDVHGGASGSGSGLVSQPAVGDSLRRYARGRFGGGRPRAGLGAASGGIDYAMRGSGSGGPKSPFGANAGAFPYRTGSGSGFGQGQRGGDPSRRSTGPFEESGGIPGTNAGVGASGEGEGLGEWAGASGNSGATGGSGPFDANVGSGRGSRDGSVDGSGDGPGGSANETGSANGSVNGSPLRSGDGSGTREGGQESAGGGRFSGSRWSSDSSATGPAGRNGFSKVGDARQGDPPGAGAVASDGSPAESNGTGSTESSPSTPVPPPTFDDIVFPETTNEREDAQEIDWLDAFLAQGAAPPEEPTLDYGFRSAGLGQIAERTVIEVACDSQGLLLFPDGVRVPMDAGDDGRRAAQAMVRYAVDRLRTLGQPAPGRYRVAVAKIYVAPDGAENFWRLRTRISSPSIEVRRVDVFWTAEESPTRSSMEQGGR